MGFGETVADEEPGSVLNKERLRSLKQACSRTIQTPALKDLCAGRTTVDAREKD